MSEVKRISPSIHQAVYGYESGHRELAASKNLSSADKHTLLIYTDRSAPSEKMEPQGYLTGFPLGEEGAYALIRTWPAPEVERPGSVWSHVLLIDFSELARVPNLGILNTCFLRPDRRPGYLDLYRNQCAVARPTSGGLSPQLDEEAAAIVLHAVYDKADLSAQVDISHMHDVETLVLELWSQQWPRLRRRFRFCSFCDAGKSEKFSDFDLQLFRGSSITQRSAYLWDSGSFKDQGHQRSWLAIAHADLVGRDSGLRSFLRSKASDVNDGRHHFSRLCEIYRDLYGEAGRDGLTRAISATLQAFGRNEGKLLKKDVVDLAASSSDRLPLSSLKDVLRFWEQEDVALPMDSVIAFGRKLWKQQPQAFLNAETPSIFFNSLDEIVPTLSDRAILEGLETAPDLCSRVIPLAPSLLYSAEAWSKPIAPALLEEVSPLDAQNDDQAMIIAFAEGAALDVARNAAGAFGEHAVSEAILSSPKVMESPAGRELAAALLVGSAGYDFLLRLANADHVRLERQQLETWANKLGAVGMIRAVDKTDDAGRDPWATLLHKDRSNEGQLSGSPRLECWVLLRALKFEGDQAADLLGLTLDPVISALEAGLLPSTDYGLFRVDLDSTEWWERVSDSDRLLRTVAKKAWSEHFTLTQFLGLSASEDVLSTLIRSLEAKYKGWSYLKDLSAQRHIAAPESVNRFDAIISGRPWANVG